MKSSAQSLSFKPDTLWCLYLLHRGSTEETSDLLGCYTGSWQQPLADNSIGITSCMSTISEEMVMEIHGPKMPVVSRTASTAILPSLISGWVNTFHLLFLFHFANPDQRWWRTGFSSARLPSDSCGNLCELALCSTLCFLLRVLSGMCCRLEQNAGLLAFLLLGFPYLLHVFPLGHHQVTLPQSLAPDVNVSNTTWSPSTFVSL